MMSRLMDKQHAHGHVFSTSPAFLDMLRRLNMRVITICVLDKHYRLPGYVEVAPQHAMAREVARPSIPSSLWTGFRTRQRAASGKSSVCFLSYHRGAILPHAAE